tara:strand:+ start:218 stop:421 length:204 start_codon:yes stop_codon:yes gene_type:complete
MRAKLQKDRPRKLLDRAPAELNEFVLRHVGQMTVGEDGTLSPHEALEVIGASHSPASTPRVGLEPTT